MLHGQEQRSKWKSGRVDDGGGDEVCWELFLMGDVGCCCRVVFVARDVGCARSMLSRPKEIGDLICYRHLFPFP